MKTWIIVVAVILALSVVGLFLSAFNLSWLGDAGSKFVKFTFDDDIAPEVFLDKMLVVCIWAICICFTVIVLSCALKILIIFRITRTPAEIEAKKKKRKFKKIKPEETPVAPQEPAPTAYKLPSTPPKNTRPSSVQSRIDANNDFLEKLRNQSRR